MLDRISIENELQGNQIIQNVKLNSNYSDLYLEPQITHQHKYVILNRKPGKESFGVYSISGEKFLPIPFESKGNIFLPQYITMNMGLFIIGTLSRYHPEIWDTFMRYDLTGAKNLVNDFFQKVLRYFPNLVLNIIEGERIHFRK